CTNKIFGGSMAGEDAAILAAALTGKARRSARGVVGPASSRTPRSSDLSAIYWDNLYRPSPRPDKLPVMSIKQRLPLLPLAVSARESRLDNLLRAERPGIAANNRSYARRARSKASSQMQSWFSDRQSGPGSV